MDRVSRVFPAYICNHIRNTQPRFTTASLKSPDGPYPELRAKAYNACELQDSNMLQLMQCIGVLIIVYSNADYKYYLINYYNPNKGLST